MVVAHSFPSALMSLCAPEWCQVSAINFDWITYVQLSVIMFHTKIA